VKQPPCQAGHEKGQTQDKITLGVELLKRDQRNTQAVNANASGAHGLLLLFQKPEKP
jgi:hypothetical protein